MHAGVPSMSGSCLPAGLTKNCNAKSSWSKNWQRQPARGVKDARTLDLSCWSRTRSHQRTLQPFCEGTLQVPSDISYPLLNQSDWFLKKMDVTRSSSPPTWLQAARITPTAWDLRNSDIHFPLATSSTRTLSQYIWEWTSTFSHHMNISAFLLDPTQQHQRPLSDMTACTAFSRIGTSLW